MTRLRYLAGLLLLNLDPTSSPKWSGDDLPAAHLGRLDPAVVAQAAARATPGDVLDPKKAGRDEAPAMIQESKSSGPRPDAAAADLARMQGVWSVDRYEFAGQSFPSRCDPLVARDSDLIFRGEHRLRHGPGKVIEPHAVIKLRPETEPKQIDFIPTDGTSAAHGIYKFEEDQLILCLADAGLPIRPTEFTTGEGLPIRLVVCRRLGDVGPDHAPGIPKDGEKAEVVVGSGPVVFLLSILRAAGAVGRQGGDDGVVKLAAEVPDLTAEELAGLTVDQLDLLSKAYDGALRAVLRGRRGGSRGKPDDGAGEIEAARQLVFDLLPAKSRRPNPEPGKPSLRPARYGDDLMRMHRISTAIAAELVTKSLNGAK